MAVESLRRSKRQRLPVDYTGLMAAETDEDWPPRIDHLQLARSVMEFPALSTPPSCHPGRVDGGSSSSDCRYRVEVLSPKELLPHVHLTGFQNPCLVRSSKHAARTLGIRLPKGKLTIQRLGEIIGPTRRVDTIDVSSQSEGPVYTMEEWVAYFLSPAPKKRLLNVVSLDLSDTPLCRMVRVPTLVSELDLVEKVWPCKAHRPPKVQLYALTSVANCFMDFHVDFGGSSVWYHILSGEKVFVLAPPTKGNLLMFEEWASSERQSSTFFAERAFGCLKVELQAGDTLFLPGGWPHSVVTPVDSLVIGGNFLTGYNLSLQLDIWNMEERLKVQSKFRYPMFKQLMWHSASFYSNLIMKDNRRHKIAISSWEKEGLADLWKLLQSWLQSYNDSEVPKEIADAAALLRNMQKCLKKKLGIEPMDCA